MALNVTSTVAAISSMNFTADCSISVRWLEAQSSRPSDPDSSINIAFLRAVLPASFSSFSNLTLSNFYDQLAIARPSIWYDPAVENIQAGCLAPKLATALAFGDLDLTANCSATVAFYGNTLCAINGPESKWIAITVGNSNWIVDETFNAPLNSTSGLSMLRNALPSQYSNISDVELATWSLLTIEETTALTNESQVARICDLCLKEFCISSAFTGNPDIAGIGAMVSYVMGAGLVTISLLFWLFKTSTDWYYGTDAFDPRGSFRLAVFNTLGALLGGSIALALSLSLALCVLLIRGGSSYYEEVMAENATYTAFYILIILTIYFPLTSFKGSEFATIWMTLYYVLIWIQLISLIAVIYISLAKDNNIVYGDQACLQTQLGGSLRNNPIVYSILFVVVSGISRFLLIVSFTFKALGKWFHLYRSWKESGSLDTALTKNQRRMIRFLRGFSDTETISLLVALPLFLLGGVILFLISILNFILWDLFTNRPLNDESERKRHEFYERIAGLMESCFKKASYGAWFLSFLSLPLMWLEIAFMWRVRHAMSTVAGASWIENQIGFGQILALLLWMPVIVGFILSLSTSNYSWQASWWGFTDTNSIPQYKSFLSEQFSRFHREHPSLRTEFLMTMKSYNIESIGIVWRTVGRVLFQAWEGNRSRCEDIWRDLNSTLIISNDNFSTLFLT